MHTHFAAAEFGGGMDREYCVICKITLRVMRWYVYNIDKPNVFPHGFSAWKDFCKNAGRLDVVAIEEDWFKNHGMEAI